MSALLYTEEWKPKGLSRFWGKGKFPVVPLTLWASVKAVKPVAAKRRKQNSLSRTFKLDSLGKVLRCYILRKRFFSDGLFKSFLVPGGVKRRRRNRRTEKIYYVFTQ